MSTVCSTNTCALGTFTLHPPISDQMQLESAKSSLEAIFKYKKLARIRRFRLKFPWRRI
jgi:hypothetical protein